MSEDYTNREKQILSSFKKVRLNNAWSKGTGMENHVVLGSAVIDACSETTKKLNDCLSCERTIACDTTGKPAATNQSEGKTGISSLKFIIDEIISDAIQRWQTDIDVAYKERILPETKYTQRLKNTDYLSGIACIFSHNILIKTRRDFIDKFFISDNGIYLVNLIWVIDRVAELTIEKMMSVNAFTLDEFEKTFDKLLPRQRDCIFGYAESECADLPPRAQDVLIRNLYYGIVTYGSARQAAFQAYYIYQSLTNKALM